MKQRWRAILGIDLRSLALFRLGLGAFLLLDLVNRAADLTAHYTWDGVARKILALGGLGAPPQLTENTFCC